MSNITCGVRLLRGSVSNVCVSITRNPDKLLGRLRTVSQPSPFPSHPLSPTTVPAPLRTASQAPLRSLSTARPTMMTPTKPHELSQCARESDSDLGPQSGGWDEEEEPICVGSMSTEGPEKRIARVGAPYRAFLWLNSPLTASRVGVGVDRRDDSTSSSLSRGSDIPGWRLVGRIARCTRVGDATRPRKSRICGRYICCSNSRYAQGEMCVYPQIKFEARKHRQRHAPEGSGAPVGTEYHWLIGEGTDGRHSLLFDLCLANL